MTTNYCGQRREHDKKLGSGAWSRDVAELLARQQYVTISYDQAYEYELILELCKLALEGRAVIAPAGTQIMFESIEASAMSVTNAAINQDVQARLFGQVLCMLAQICRGSANEQYDH